MADWTTFWLIAMFAALTFNLVMRVLEVRRAHRMEIVLDQMRKILIKLAERDSGARQMILNEVLKQEPPV